jgi:hypothetical protein
MSAQVAADLRAAAEVLRRDGWTQEKFTSLAGCHCAAGAMRMVAEDVEKWRDAIDALCDGLAIAPYPISVYRWNDAPERTADEVIAALEAAADAAEAAQ